MRLPLIERWLDEIASESVLEVGCGMGAMGYRLASRYDYRGYEPDPISYQTAALRLADLGRGEVRNEAIPDDPDRVFDLLVAFEVLEHIEDDAEALASWRRWLAPGGHLVISVPGHPHRFGPCDEAAGHCRRYRRDELEDRLSSSGFEPLAIESWGMPMGYLLEAARNRLAGRQRGDQEVGTSGSGRFYQPPARLGRTVELAMRPAALLQKPFRNTERGIGYIAVARLADPTV